MNLAQVLAALGNPIRLDMYRSMARGTIRSCCNRILYYEGAVCVSDLVNKYDLAQSTVSHHLSVLVRTGLVKSEKRGPWTCYFVDREFAANLLETLKKELALAANCQPTCEVSQNQGGSICGEV